MVNFYHRFIQNAASIQLPLLEAISGRIVNSDKTIEWTPDMVLAFQKLKETLAQEVLLAHPSPGTSWSVHTDASDVAIGAILQQQIDGHFSPLSFLSRRLTPAQSRYSAYDRELYTVYTEIKHFRYMLEGRNFAVFTDHKPLIYAFQQKLEKASPRQARYLTYISEFTTDLIHVFGQDNVITDTLSRIDEITFPGLLIGRKNKIAFN